MWEDNPVWNVDPILAPFKKIPVTGRMAGYAGRAEPEGPPRCAPNTLSSTCTRRRSKAMMPEESVKWAHDEAGEDLYLNR